MRANRWTWRLTGRAAAAVGGVLAVVIAGVVSAGPASARMTDPGDDVTAETMSHVQKVGNRLFGQGINAWVSEDYSASPAGRYVYTVQFIPTDAEHIWKSTCAVTRNGVRIARGTCADLYWDNNGILMQRSGNYVILVDGKPLWKFTFTIRHPNPPPLAPALCTIDSVAPGASTGGAQVFTIKSSGACNDGQWSWSTEFVDGGHEMEVFVPRADGKVTVTGVDFATKPQTITFQYFPNGYHVLSAYSLHSEPGVPGFTRVPSTAGY